MQFFLIWTFFLLLISGLILEVSLEEVEMASYFPEFLDDLSDIRWIHAINTRRQLEEALNSDAEMLEADVSLGTIVGRNPGLKEPIMAHPPMNESDLNLQEFLNEVIRAKKRKGIKLDFKSIEIVHPSFQIISNLFSEIEFPIWLNADILPGPVNASSRTVTSFLFFFLCKASFPLSVVSPGWTTYNSEKIPIEEREYGWDHVVEMAAVLRDAGVEQPITFPVRATFVLRSLDKLRWLLAVVPNSTLTVFSSDKDDVDVEELLAIRCALPMNKIYYDLPSHQDVEFRKRKKDVTSCVVSSGSSCGVTQSFTSDVHRNNHENGRVLSAETTLAFLKPCNYSVNLLERSSNVTYDRIRGVLEFLKARASPASSQSFVISFGPSRELILLDRNGLVHLVEPSKLLNATKLNRSRCYAFQLSFNNVFIVDDDEQFLNVSFWPINCRTDEPFDPSEDAFVVIVPIKNTSNATGFSLNVDNRGDSLKVLRNIQYVCKDAQSKLTVAAAASNTIFSVNCFLAFLLLVLNINYPVIINYYL